MTRLLLTGIAGFIGSHIVEHIQANTDWDIVGLATFRHRGDPLRVEAFDPKRISILHADLTAPLSHRLIETIGPIDYVINAAADSHVDRSIVEPQPFIENNVSLVISMLEYARIAKPRAFIQVSTDEVYGPAAKDYFAKEWDPIIPSNPYSASKAAQEAIAISYWRTYGVPVVITNTMNNFGERQDTEKYIPMLISRINRGEEVTVHGRQDEIGSRFYMHARNHADALLFLLNHILPVQHDEGYGRPDRYNVVGDREIDNLTLAQMVADILGKPLRYRLVDFHSTRPGHDLRYALDGARLRDLGWEPPISVEDSLERTVNWTLENPAWLS
jgi:dTDP-glucose 4,6-dehydratase